MDSAAARLQKPPGPRRPRLVWWHGLIGAILILIAAAVATAYLWRAAGHDRCVAMVERLRAEGRPSSLDEFIARAPTVDTDLEEAWDSWQKRYPNARGVATPLYPTAPAHREEWAAWVTGRGPLPEAVSMAARQSGPACADALPLLRRSGLVISGYGWIAHDLPPGKRTQCLSVPLRLAQLLAVRDLGEWLHLTAVMADDPRQPLDDLNALVTALGHPACLIDSMVAVAITGVRDQTYVELAVRGKLPQEAQRLWLAEAPHALPWVGDGLEGEGMIFSLGMVGMLEHEPNPFAFVQADGGWQGLTSGLTLWISGYGDCARNIWIETRLAQRLRGERSVSWSTVSEGRSHLNHSPGWDRLATYREMAITALQSDASERMTRLAVRILALVRGAALPADQPALLAALGEPSILAPPGDHLRLRYEVPEPHRFRLVVDPGSPLPDFDEPGRMAARCRQAGSPPAAEPLVLTTNGFGIEVLVPEAR